MDMFSSTLSTLHTKSHKVYEVDKITPQQTRYINHQPRKGGEKTNLIEGYRLNSLWGDVG